MLRKHGKSSSNTITNREVDQISYNLFKFKCNGGEYLKIL